MIFILLAEILIFFQIRSFIFEPNLPNWNMFLIIFVTVGSIIGGSLIYIDKTDSADRIAGALSLLVCFSLAILVYYLALIEYRGITRFEYITMLVYAAMAGVYGFIGLAVKK